MFPKSFHTVYSDQGTICPLDLLRVKPPQVANLNAYRCQPLPEYRHTPVPPTTVTASDINNRVNFRKESRPPHNPPVQRATPNHDAIDSHGARRVVSDPKADLPQCENNSVLGKRPGPSEAQKEQVKRRRKKEADVLCKIPGCGGDFTTGGRLETHVMGTHLGIKKYICVWPGCSYATAYATDLDRHWNSTVHAKLEEKKRKMKEREGSISKV